MSEVGLEAVKAVQRLRRVIAEIEESGSASASISSGGGSRSYTRLDLAQLYKNLAMWEKRATRQVLGAGGFAGVQIARPNFGGV